LHVRRPGRAGLDARHGALGLVLLAVAGQHRTGSPSPNSLHSFFSKSLGLAAITALAARRMWPVLR
jgi:hypothetical protein